MSAWCGECGTCRARRQVPHGGIYKIDAAESAESANICPVAKWKDPGERGDFGAWLAAQVGDRTFDWLADEMAQRGHVHGASYYRGMAGGSKPPGRAIRRALVDYFGGGPAPEEPGEADPMAAALTALVGELKAAREERARYLAMEATVEALRETVAGLLRSSRKVGGSAASQAGRAHRGSTG